MSKNSQKNQNLKNIVRSFELLKKDLYQSLQDSNFKTAQGSVKKFVKSAKKDISAIVDKDVNQIKKRVLDEKKQIDKVIDQVVLKEINKIKKFVEDQKVEFSKIQNKLEKYAQDKGVKVNLKKSPAKNPAKTKKTTPNTARNNTDAKPVVNVTATPVQTTQDTTGTSSQS